MAHVTAFGSIDELFEKIRADSDAADQQVQPWQEAAKPGMYFLRFLPEYGLVIYGEIRDSVQDEIDCGADADDVEYQRDLRAQPHMKHYRSTKSYSEACEEGEFGDIHVSTIAAFLTKESFERAKALGWPTDKRTILDLCPFTEPT